MAWAFVGMAGSMPMMLAFLAVINIVTGFSTAGANLAIGNISIKLAPKEEAIVYLTVKNMTVAFFSAIAPMVGGLLADFFASHQLTGGFSWKGEGHTAMLSFVKLQGWNFFFIIGGLFAMFSLRSLKCVREKGEVNKEKVVVYMRARLRRRFYHRNKKGRHLSSPVPGVSSSNDKTMISRIN